MIGVVLISHARVASETKYAAEHILGPQQAFEAIDIPQSDASEAERLRFRSLIEALDSGLGVLVLVDLYGATPSNIALTLLQEGKVEVVAGFNLPAVIKALTLRDKGLTLLEVAKESIEAGQQYICLGSDIKGRRKADD